MSIRALLTFATALVCLVAPASLAEDWKPVDPSHLAAKSPVVEKDADAEAIFWEVRVNDSDQDLVFSHYVRIKVFTDRGKESQSQVDIPYLGSNRINDISGRTIKPDGTMVELKKDAVFDRTIVKAGGVKIKAKSFAMPAVEPGAIIEYRWREIRPRQIANYVRLHFQRDIPVQFVKYYIKPLKLDLAYSSLGMSTMVFNGQAPPITKEKDGYYSIAKSNMPAFHEEPHMPPEDQVRMWMLIYYTVEKPQPPAEYWPKLAKEIYEENKQYMKVSDEVKKATAEAIADSTTPDEKLERIFNYCRTKIKNIYDDASGLTDSELAKIKENQSPSDTLKRGMGTIFDIDMLFAAMANAAGFEARLARIGDRGDKFFDQSYTSSYLLGGYNVAVKMTDGWHFFDPGSTYVPFGMLRWQEEGMPALITDPKQPGFVDTPNSPAEKSAQKRVAKLRLSETGTLEGDVRVEYTGQLAVQMKEQNDEDSPEQREQNIRSQVKERMSTAEVSNIKVENVTDPLKPFICSYHVRVPGYAQRTGKRLFLQPAFFQKGIPALFSASERKQAIYFHYYWMEDDNVEIELPKDFALDNAEQPGSFSAPKVADYTVHIQVVNKSEALLYKRNFTFTALFFSQSTYPALKTFFERVHESDNHTITLKQAASQ